VPQCLTGIFSLFGNLGLMLFLRLGDESGRVGFARMTAEGATTTSSIPWNGSIIGQGATQPEISSDI